MVKSDPDTGRTSDTDAAKAAQELLTKAEAQLETARQQYESAKSTYESTKALSALLGSTGLETTSAPASRSTFCEDCAKIPIKSLFESWPTSRPARRRVGDLFTAVERQSWCAFCRFLIESFQLGDEHHSERLGMHLTARDSAIYFALDPDGLAWYRRAAIHVDRPSCSFFWLQTGMPTVTGVPHICVTLDTQSATPGVRPRRRDPLEAFNGSINYPLIKSWIDRCNDDHGSKCHERFVSHPPDLEIDLIDVSTRRLVRRTIKERYVALSYVWGKSTELRLETSDLSQVKDEYDLAILAPKAPATRGSLLPKEMPQTMEDAITFTKRLGERYLWVDVYCIDQNDEVEMRAQIGAMHRIFSSAYLTLLNVDGENADWGLTGVSRPILQTNQPVVETSEGQIMATFLYSIWHNAGTTVWDSRAWTLQERLLSLRSVIFAKTYIAMACQEEYFHDILHLAPDVRTTMGDDFFREDGADIHLDEPEWDFKIYDALVSVYSGRKLTVQSDALNACLGSLNRIALSTGYSFTFGHPEEDLLRSLLWKAHHEHVSTRRSEFPSWSWLGWRGRAEYPYWVGDMADYATDSPSPTRPPPRSRSHSGSVSSSDEKDLVTRAPPTKRRRLRWFTAEDDTSHPQTAEVTLAGKPSFNEPAGSLRLETMVATFRCKHIRHNGAPHKNLKYMSQQARLAVGEHWALLDLEGELLRNTTGEHPAFESTDVWFRVDAETSARLEEWDGEVQLVFVQQWPRIRDSKASGQWRWDMVSVLVALPGIENGHAMRIAAVLLERDEWLSRKPIPGTVILI